GGAAAAVRGHDDGVAAAGGRVVCVAVRAADRVAVEEPLVAGRAARGQRDAAAGAERGRTARRDGRRGRDRVDRHGDRIRRIAGAIGRASCRGGADAGGGVVCVAVRAADGGGVEEPLI